MQWHYVALHCAAIGLLLSISSISESRELNLDEASDAVNTYFGSFHRNDALTGYGTGGYGDPLTANFNQNVCRSGETDGKNCTARDPDLGIAQWRFIRNIGWRKFSAYGVARKDWWEYKRTLGWPFSNYQKFGWNWW
jgi:hypothetical protein